jgi:hypothetical protein
MYSLQQLNPSVYIPGNCTAGQFGLTANGPCSSTSNNDARRRFNLTYPGIGNQYGDIPRIAAEGNASYNGLLLSVQRNARGVTLNGNYTWSHCISDHPEPGQTAFGTTPNVGWDGGDRRADRGNCSQSALDRRHIFNMSAVAVTPGFGSQLTRTVASNWRFSPILKVYSGEAMSMVTSLDRSLTNTFLPSVGAANAAGVNAGTINTGQRVSQVLANPYGDGTPGHFLNAAAFAEPAFGTFGNAGIGSVKGPGFWQFDLSLSRTFQIREMQRVEFRAEAFNLTNRFIMLDPTVDLNSNLFGRVTSARDPRIMQFALKYLF